MTVPAFLAPDFRYAGDDWTGTNALTYVVYQTPPVYASDGVTIVTPGEPQNLTGYTVSGTIRYQRRPGCAPQDIVVPATPTGALVNAMNGLISLSLPSASTIFPRQPITAWGNPSLAALLVQPMIAAPSGGVVTVGLQQLFVF